MSEVHWHLAWVIGAHPSPANLRFKFLVIAIPVLFKLNPNVHFSTFLVAATLAPLDCSRKVLMSETSQSTSKPHAPRSHDIHAHIVASETQPPTPNVVCFLSQTVGVYEFFRWEPSPNPDTSLTSLVGNLKNVLLDDYDFNARHSTFTFYKVRCLFWCKRLALGDNMFIGQPKEPIPLSSAREFWPKNRKSIRNVATKYEPTSSMSLRDAIGPPEDLDDHALHLIVVVQEEIDERLDVYMDEGIASIKYEEYDSKNILS